MTKNRKVSVTAETNINNERFGGGTQEEVFEFGTMNHSEPQQKKKKTANISAKRAEQNRVAQRNFREKQLQKQREMSSLLELCKAENEIMKMELNALKAEKENMIHLMDKLRSENIYLYDIKADLEKKCKSIMGTKANASLITKTYRSQPVVKGNFGLIIRPPPNPAKNRITIPPWTSHKNTFIDSATSSNSINHDTGSISTSIEKDSNLASPSNSPTNQQNIHRAAQSYPVDNNNYPGYPSWTPPTVNWSRTSCKAQSSHSKDRGTSKEVNHWEKRLPPNPLPYHLSFSYTDTKTSHNTYKPPDNPDSGQQTDLNMAISVKNEENGPLNFESVLFDKPIPNTFEENANFNAFASLFSSASVPKTTIPLQPPQLFYPNLVYGNLLGSQEILPSEGSRPLWMPFLPSTNAMVPLYHHVPFESLGSSALSISQDHFNPASDNLFFSSQQNLSFGPLSGQQNSTFNEKQSMDSANMEKNDRLKDVFLPLK